MNKIHLDRLGSYKSALRTTWGGNRMFKVLSLFIAAVLLLSTVSPAVFAEGDINVTVNFVDIENNYWANDAVSNLAKSGIIKGYEDNTFKPENHVTREELAALVSKTFYLNLPSNTAKQSFQDVSPDRWSFPYIEASKEFLTGYYPPSGNAFFSPEMDATREDVAVTLVKALGYTADDLQNPNILEEKFYDVDSISPNLQIYVALAIEKKLFSGYPDNTFKGDKPVTRAESATLLYKIIKSANSDGNTDVSLTANVQETTADGTFYVSGKTNKGATVTINDKAVDVLQGEFKEGYRIDEEGTYSVVIVSRIAGGKTKTITKQITFKKGGPVLTVGNIPESTQVGTINVTWTVKDAFDYSPKVYINDELQSSYQTSAKIDLVEGLNTLVFKATNDLGNSTIVTKTIMFSSGGPILKVDDIPNTTNLQSVNVSWSVKDANDSSPKVYINDTLQSYYSTTAKIDLVDGVNTIVFKATNELGKSTTVTKTITLNAGAPSLTVGDIPDNTTREKLSVSWTVKDSIDSSPKVFINDELQSYYTNSLSMNLIEGENTITFKATNSNGKSTSITKKITFTPPAPVLSFGYMPVNTTSSNITVSWNVSDKNDSYPKVFLNDILQSYYQTNTSVSLNVGANQINLVATNKFGKQSTVTQTVYRN